MTYGEPLSSSIPAVGAAGTGYATTINARLTEIENILESKVPYSSLQGSELDLNNVPIRDCTYLELVEGTSAPSGSPVGRLARYNNDLYWVTDEGAVRITLNGSLDASSIGGIGGNYGGGNPALVSFTDSTSMYNFYDDINTLTWAYVRSRGLDIADGAATTDVVRLRAPAIAASYTFTFPTALPASNRSVVVISSAGAVEPNDGTNTVTNDIVLGGTTKIQHGDRIIACSPAVWTKTSGTWAYSVGLLQSTVAGVAYIEIPEITLGWRIKSLKVRHTKVDTASTAFDVMRVWDAATTSLQTATSTTSGVQTTTITLSSPYTVVTTGGFIVLKITTAANNDAVYNLELTYDIPA